MRKRRNRAEATPQVVRTQPMPPPAVEPKLPRRAKAGQTTGSERFHAATRVGKKKVTGNLLPSKHKLFKILAVQRETTAEALLEEAVDDLLAKYSVKHSVS